MSRSNRLFQPRIARWFAGLVGGTLWLTALWVTQVEAAVVGSRSGGSPVGQDDGDLAAELGLEPSEYGRLRATERLGIDDPDLRTALDFLAQRPFRLLPTEERGPVRRVSGHLLRLIRHRASSEAEEGWIYECWVRLAEDLAGSVAVGDGGEVAAAPAGSTFRVLTRHIPRDWGRLEWQADGPGRFQWAADSDQALWMVSALTIDLGVSQVVASAGVAEASDAEAGPRWPTGLAKRLEWREDSAVAVTLGLAGAASVSPGRAEAWARLGRAGFDLGLWDSVAAGQRRPLTPADNEPFYQLLRISPELTSADAAEPLPIRDLIRQPQEHVGQPFRVQAVVKQVTRVPSDAGDRGTQLGVTEYYLLHALVPLPRPLRLKFDGERQIEYSQHFPVVIATRRLPAGLEVGDQGRQWVAGQGVFFKLWSYQSQRSQAAGVEQWAPLLVADDLQRSGPLDTGNPPWPIGGLLLIPLGLSLLFLLWAGFRSVGR